MKLFKRIFKIGQAEAHSAIDQLENPIKLTEQGIRDMKEDLDKALKALAEVKAMAIRARNEGETALDMSKDYEQKAMIILSRVEKGELSAEEGDRIARQALVKKAEADEQLKRSQTEQENFNTRVSQLESSVRTIRNNISNWENELKTLKARVKVSTATKNINKQMAQIDGTNTVAMLERMKEKVSEEEALSEAYGDIANESKSVDDEIDKALGNPNESSAEDALAALKAKLNK